MTSEWRYRVFLLLVFILGIGLVRFDSPCPEIFSHGAVSSKLCSPVWASLFHGTVVEPLVEIAHKIGEALIIATLLALIVDESAKKKLMRDFSLDISSYIIGRLLPEGLRKHLQDYLEMHLVRKSWNITYTIKKEALGYIELTTSSVDVMENRLDETQSYNFIYFLEVSQCPNEQSVITCIELPGESALMGKPLTDQINIVNGYHGFNRAIELKPSSKEASELYRFRVETTECKRDTDSSLFYSKYPVMEATLIVMYHEVEFGVTLDLTYHGHIPEPQKSIENGMNKVKWEIKHPIPPMLPGQGFLLKWNVKKPISNPGSRQG
jgi:hypothetical protein